MAIITQSCTLNLGNVKSAAPGWSGCLTQAFHLADATGTVGFELFDAYDVAEQGAEAAQIIGALTPTRPVERWEELGLPAAPDHLTVARALGRGV